MPGDPGQEQFSGLDIEYAHSARNYNHWLGGKGNDAADREAEQAIAANKRPGG